MKKFIPGSCGIGCLCSNMRIEANQASYNMELRKQDIETQGERHEIKSKVLPQGRQERVSI